MSTIEERAPIHPTTDQLLDELRQTLARAERLWTDLAALLANGPATTDPLAGFRTPAGTVAYTTSYADQLKPGDMVQACHGDPGWHRVTDVRPGWLRTRCAIGDPDGAGRAEVAG